MWGLVFDRGYDFIVSPGSNRSRGSVILFKNSISLKNHCVDSEGRLVLGEFAIRELPFRVCCVYAPNQVRARNEFFEFCCDFIDSGIPTVVCGDFNTIFNQSTDRRGSDPLDSSRVSSLALQEDLLCVRYLAGPAPTDIGVYVGEHGPFACFTYMIGCPTVCAPLVSSCEIVPCPFSYHAAVVLSFSPPVPISRGPGR